MSCAHGILAHLPLVPLSRVNRENVNSRLNDAGEKLRKRLDHLEMLAASVAQSRQTALAGESTTEVALPVTPNSDQTPAPSDQVVPRPETPRELGGSWAAGGSSGTQVVPTRGQPPMPSPPPHAGEPSSSSSLDLSTLWDTATFIDPSYLLLNKHADDAGHAELWYTSLVECGCPVRHVEIRSRKPGTFDTAPILSIGDATMTSDLYMNNIRIEMSCVIAALWANCLQIGVSQSMFCEDESVSPFYRPGSGGDDAAAGATTITTTTSGRDRDRDRDEARDGIVSTVQSIFKTLKPDLRPTREQITTSHHPCIDMFPFPTLRRNILGGGGADEDEFVHDVLQGLACWGGAGGAAGGGGAPWDARSWEAKPWFLRKYWALLGGEEGELVRQSGWWRSVRGEEGDVWACA